MRLNVLFPIIALLLLFVVGFLQISCNSGNRQAELPSMPLIMYDFNEQVHNKGVLPVFVRGDGHVSYATGISGQSLDLSATAKYRKPLIITKSAGDSFNDYPGITLMFWTKMDSEDNNAYTIISQKTENSDFNQSGWRIGAAGCGAWYWQIFDGFNTASYMPTSRHQPINDGEWHQIGFSLDFQAKEARLYYNGRNVSVISLQQFNLNILDNTFVLGGDPTSALPLMETYNGLIDDFSVYSRILTPEQVGALYAKYRPTRISRQRKLPDSLIVMTWNIWNGGQRDGKFVGVQRITDVIRQSGADIVSLQETFGSGEMIADALGYFHYQRSDGLSVLSRYPLGRTYNIYRSRMAGAVTIELPGQRQVVFCPIHLSYLPNLGPYIMSGNAVADTILARELESRGAEMRFIAWELQSLLNQKDQAPLILAGDFNSGSHLDWTEANSANRYGLVIDFPSSRLLEQAGYIDAYRKIYPDPVEHPGHTWSPVFNEVLQDRVNFIYYSGLPIEPVNAYVIDSYPLGFPSDHAAVVTTFRWR